MFTPSNYAKLNALSNISFSIKKGEFFGIIGPNGSGKSTLLKILAQIYEPNSGKVEIKGKVSPFIELGVGFNPELTAKDNIFLNGAILGLSRKETEERFEEIIQFAELEEFIDQKLKNFSSGMQVRLAFAIAIQASAEILLIDEVLAVGDASFQQKCFEVFRELKRKGTTIIFVSHGLDTVQEFCDRVALLNRGKFVSLGKPRNVINTYYSLITEKEANVLEEAAYKGNNEKRWGDKRAEVIDSWIETEKGDKILVVKGKLFRVVVEYEFFDEVIEPIFGLIIRDSNKRDVYVTNTKLERVRTGIFKKSQKIKVIYEFNNVFEGGEYTLSPAVADRYARRFHDWRNDFKRFIIQKENRTGGIINMSNTINIRSI